MDPVFLANGTFKDAAEAQAVVFHGVSSAPTPADTEKAKFQCAQAFFAKTGEQFQQIPGREQDRVYTAVAAALAPLGRKETVGSLRELALAHLVSLQEGHAIRKAVQGRQDGFDTLVAEFMDPNCLVFSGWNSDFKSAVEMRLLADALKLNIVRFEPAMDLLQQAPEMRHDCFPTSQCLKYPQSIKLVDLNGVCMPVVAKVAAVALPPSASVAQPQVAANVDIASADRLNAIRADFLRCRTQEERAAFLQRVREAERARYWQITHTR